MSSELRTLVQRRVLLQSKVHIAAIKSNKHTSSYKGHDDNDAASVGGQFEGRAVVLAEAITGACACCQESGERRACEGCR